MFSLWYSYPGSIRHSVDIRPARPIQRLITEDRCHSHSLYQSSHLRNKGLRTRLTESLAADVFSTSINLDDQNEQGRRNWSSQRTFPTREDPPVVWHSRWDRLHSPRIVHRSTHQYVFESMIRSCRYDRSRSHYPTTEDVFSSKTKGNRSTRYLVVKLNDQVIRSFATAKL